MPSSERPRIERLPNAPREPDVDIVVVQGGRAFHFCEGCLFFALIFYSNRECELPLPGFYTLITCYN